MLNPNQIRQRLSESNRRELDSAEAVGYICLALTNRDRCRHEMIEELWEGGKYFMPEYIFNEAILYLMKNEDIINRYSLPMRDGSHIFWYTPYDRGNALFLEFGTLWYEREYSKLFGSNATYVN